MSGHSLSCSASERRDQKSTYAYRIYRVVHYSVSMALINSHWLTAMAVLVKVSQWHWLIWDINSLALTITNLAIVLVSIRRVIEGVPTRSEIAWCRSFKKRSPWRSFRGKGPLRFSVCNKSMILPALLGSAMMLMGSGVCMAAVLYYDTSHVPPFIRLLVDAVFSMWAIAGLLVVAIVILGVFVDVPSFNQQDHKTVR